MTLEAISKHKYMVIGGLTVILILIVFLLYSLASRTIKTEEFRGAVGEPVEYPLEYPPTLTPDESQIGDTGYMEEEYEGQELQEIEQINDLRLKTPYQGNNFIINYNYETYKFDVILFEPYDESERSFQQWQSINYKNIPTDKYEYTNQ